MDEVRSNLYRLHPELAVAELEELEELVRTLFSFLDHQEETDEGRLFRPINISCVRAMMIEPLNQCLTALKAKLTVYDGNDTTALNSETGKRLIRVCNVCSASHHAITRAEAENEVLLQRDYFEATPKENRFDLFGSTKFSAENALKVFTTCCQCGNSHYFFHDKKEEEITFHDNAGWVIVKD